MLRRDGLFGGGVVVAQEAAAFGGDADDGALAEQAGFEFLRRCRPVPREVEAGRTLEGFVQEVERADVGDAVGAWAVLRGGDEIPDARLEDEAERVEIAGDGILPAFIADADAAVAPDGGGERRQKFKRLDARIPGRGIEMEARGDALGVGAGVWW